MRARYRKHDAKLAIEKAKMIEEHFSSISSDCDDNEETCKTKPKKSKLSKLITKALLKKIDKTKETMQEDRDVTYDKNIRYNILGPMKLGR